METRACRLCLVVETGQRLHLESTPRWSARVALAAATAEVHTQGPYGTTRWGAVTRRAAGSFTELQLQLFLKLLRLHAVRRAVSLANRVARRRRCRGAAISRAGAAAKRHAAGELRGGDGVALHRGGMHA